MYLVYLRFKKAKAQEPGFTCVGVLFCRFHVVMFGPRVYTLEQFQSIRVQEKLGDYANQHLCPENVWPKNAAAYEEKHHD